MALSKPNKHLTYDEHHFEGYWVRLMALIRQNDDADEVLDELVPSPVATIVALPDGQLKAAWVTAYTNSNLPYPTEETSKLDPIGTIRHLLLAGRVEVPTQNWIAANAANITKYRKGVKFIYQTCVATLSVQQATEIVGDLPYGSGLRLLQRLKQKQHRQTNMSLFVLFDNILGMKLKAKETLSMLFARLTSLRRRLSNWNPRIDLPDQLILVCILRALPAKYAPTCTIIMATRAMDLETAKTMLLDAENADARLITRNLGSEGNPNSGNPVGNALTVGTVPKKKGKKYTEAYLKEGCCPEHPDGCHAESECWKLHPELRPKKKKVAAANVVRPEVSESLYGFLTGNCLIATHGMHCMHELTPKRANNRNLKTAGPVKKQQLWPLSQSQSSTEQLGLIGQSQPGYQPWMVPSNQSNGESLKIPKQNLNQNTTKSTALIQTCVEGVVVDSGACSHITNTKKSLQSLQPAQLAGIKDLTGQVSTVEGMGSTKSVKNILYVPQSKHNLLSVGSLIDQVGGKIIFTKKSVFLKRQNKVVSVGVRHSDGLYKVTNPKFDISAKSKITGTKMCQKKVSFDDVTNITNIPKSQINSAMCNSDLHNVQSKDAYGKLSVRATKSKVNCNSNSQCSQMHKNALISNEAISIELKKQQVQRLHRCFGHPSKPKLKQIVQNYPELKISSKEVDLLESCGSCALGKTKRKAKPKKSETKATRFGERLSSDCSGKIRTQSVSGKKYAWLTVDQYSGWVWSAPVASLKEVPELLRTLLEVNLHQRFDYSVDYFRSDNGSEFCNEKVDNLLRQYNIKRELTCPYSSYQNGQAERHIGIIFATMRTVLADSQLPKKYWAEALLWSTYVHNRTPGPSGKTPFELRYNKKPKIGHLRPFGCPCTILMRLKSKDKAHSISEYGTLVGYGYVTGQKGYRILLNKSRKVLTSQNVAFIAYDKGVLRRITKHADLKLESNEVQFEVNKEPVVTHNTKIESTHTGSTSTTTQQNIDSVQPVQLSLSEELPPANQVQSSATSTDVLTNKQEAVQVESPITIEEQAEDDQTEYQTEHHHSGASTSMPATKNFYYLSDSESDDEDTPQSDITNEPRTTRSGCAFVTTKIDHVSDCIPNYIALVSEATTDLRTSHVTPKHYRDAMRSPDSKHWNSAMNSELQALRKMDAYELVPRSKVPSGTTILGYVWVYKIKILADGTIARYKARITADGSKQRYGIDIDETFSPVCNASTIRLVLAIATHHKMILRQYDIKLAFLSAETTKPVYMKIPAGSGEPSDHVWKLKRCLYGLRDSPRQFNAKLDKTLTLQGWKASPHDPCLYIYNAKGIYALLVIVVDDMILATNNKAFTEEFYKSMKVTFDFKDLGEPTYVIGLQLQRTTTQLSISQQRFILDSADRFKECLSTIKPVKTPLPAKLQFIKSGTTDDPDSPLVNEKLYRSLVGTLMYAVVSRPDVATAVSQCARYFTNPTKVHMTYALRVLSYLKHTAEYKLTYYATDKPCLSAYVDASWGDDIETRRSRYGYAVYYGRALISWRSKLHSCISLSSAQAEFTAATEVTKEVMWLRHLLSSVNLKERTSTPIHEDNRAVLKMASNLIISSRNKHMDLKMFYVRERVLAKDVHLMDVSTKNQRADLLTKNLSFPAFSKFRSMLLQPSTYRET